MKDLKKYCAESFGTMVLVLFGCGSAVIGGSTLGVFGIAMAFGLSIVAMAYTIGKVSGCHLNPAVSIAMLINKRISFKEFIFYCLSQIIGAFIGSGILFLILKSGGYETTNMGQNSFGVFTADGALFIEFILTFVFVSVVVGVTGKKGDDSKAGIIIGLTLVLIHILGIPLTGTSVNPARSIAPAVFVGGVALKELWVFILAPLVGGALAAIFNKFVLGSEDKK